MTMRFMAWRRPLALLLSVALLAGPAPLALAKPDHRPVPASRYLRAKKGVRLSPAVLDKVTAIAKRYHAKTKRSLLVTSGVRSPLQQAHAMYGKLRAGDRLRGYRNKSAVQPLREIYDKGRRKRWKKSRIVSSMAKVIQAQTARGVYLSKHLRAGAVDIRSIGMTRRQRRAFMAAVREVGGISAILERRPPHFHLQLRSTAAK